MPATREQKYIEAVGRRKTATARVRLYFADKHEITVNDKNVDDYFPTEKLADTVREPFATTPPEETFSVSVHVNGGGVNAQAEAARHGIARALVDHDESKRSKLKKAGYLKRDPRSKERKKFGLKKARKASQWSKR